MNWVVFPFLSVSEVFNPEVLKLIWVPPFRVRVKVPSGFLTKVEKSPGGAEKLVKGDVAPTGVKLMRIPSPLVSSKEPSAFSINFSCTLSVQPAPMGLWTSFRTRTKSSIKVEIAEAV